MTKRWLPDHVTAYRDRHGKARYRFRKAGQRDYHFRHEPGTEEFLAELRHCQTEQSASTGRAKSGSVDDLCERFYASSPRWAALSPQARKNYTAQIERFRAKHGKRAVKDATVADLDRYLASMAETPSAANNMRKRLKMLFGFAIKLGWRADNPAAHTDSFKETGSYHTWTDAEIEQYRARHAYGTKARLALELALNIAARRASVADLRRSQLIDGNFHVQHGKGNEFTIVPIMAEAQAAIDAMPVAGIGHFLVTMHGKPYSVAGFGNAAREWCDQAGLTHCTFHGLRKAQSRRLAEAGSSDAQGRAVTGHKKDATFAYYAARANRASLARDAVANLEARLGEPMANHPENKGKSDA